MIDYIEPIHKSNPDPVWQSKAYQRGLKRKKEFLERREFDRIFKEVRERHLT